MHKQGSLAEPLWRASLRPAIPVRLTRRWRFRKPRDLDEDTAHLIYDSMPLSERNPQIRGALALHKTRLRRQVYRAFLEQERAVNKVTIRQTAMYETLVRLHEERRRARRELHDDALSEHDEAARDHSTQSEPHAARRRELLAAAGADTGAGAGARALAPAGGTPTPMRPVRALDAVSLPPLPGERAARPVDAFFESIPDAVHGTLADALPAIQPLAPAVGRLHLHSYLSHLRSRVAQ